MRFAIAYGYIVTANEEGNATLNSQIAAQLDKGQVNKATELLIHQANAAPELLEALERVANVADTAFSVLRKSNPEEAKRFRNDAEVCRKAIAKAKGE